MSKTTLTVRKIECPFDLEAIFQINYSTSGLKQVLEFILDHLGEYAAENANLAEELAKL
jgi:hypothetical protein